MPRRITPKVDSAQVFSSTSYSKEAYYEDTR